MSASDVSASTTVAAPPATVFAILADPREHPRIDGSGSVREVVTGPDRLALGSTFGMSMKIGAPYRIKNTVVEFEEDRRIAWRHAGPHRWRYDLEPTEDGGTRVTETWDLSHCNSATKWLFGLLRYPRTHARSIERTLTNLKQAAEADAAA